MLALQRVFRIRPQVRSQGIPVRALLMNLGVVAQQMLYVHQHVSPSPVGMRRQQLPLAALVRKTRAGPQLQVQVQAGARMTGLRPMIRPRTQTQVVVYGAQEICRRVIVGSITSASSGCMFVMPAATPRVSRDKLFRSMEAL